MLTLEEFRQQLINNMESEGLTYYDYPERRFLEYIEDILVHDYCILSQIDDCYFDLPYDKTTNRKGIHINGCYFEESANTLHLVTLDYNNGNIETLTKDLFDRKINYLKNYFEAVISGYFKTGERSDPAVQYSYTIIENFNRDEIYKINLILASTNRFSSGAKLVTSLSPITIKNKKIELDVTSLDIDSIYKTKQIGFKKEPINIVTTDFGIDGLPCIKADLDKSNYDAYLVIVPGTFLSDIYKKYNSRLLEDNVRSFLNFRGGINKGIRGTILNEKTNFFAYNNGISATASRINVEFDDKKGFLIKELENLQIINGGQTTASLAATSIKDKADLTGIFVQMKLTIVENRDDAFITNIAKYANSQNKVTAADLNSNHQFYIRMQDLSRKIYTPKSTNVSIQTRWYFERSRGQYDQEMLQLSKAQIENFKLQNPPEQRITKTDIAKYLNSDAMRPYDVSWGSDVNATKFYAIMEEDWEKNDSKYNEVFYKELIGKAILFKHIEKIISGETWYKERNGYRAQLVTYTFSKLVYGASQYKKYIDYLEIWNKQRVPDIYDEDIKAIAYDCFVLFYGPSISNISTYCKKKEAWNAVKEMPHKLSPLVCEALISKTQKEAEQASAKKDQRLSNIIDAQIFIFNLGADNWETLLQKGKEQKLLNYNDEQMIKVAINFCITGGGCYDSQVKKIMAVIEKLQENGVPMPEIVDET